MATETSNTEACDTCTPAESTASTSPDNTAIAAQALPVPSPAEPGGAPLPLISETADGCACTPAEAAAQPHAGPHAEVSHTEQQAALRAARAASKAKE